MAKAAAKCEWLGLQDALRAFVQCESGHQGAGHIKPLHWYVACRLVIEGGFDPEDITPRPPFSIRGEGGRRILAYDPPRGGMGERTILGGLRTKAVDVVVTRNGVGPVVAVSTKGTLNAFRNLTNRMEEAVGDCTNLHIAYPALVYGFLHVLRATREAPGVEPNDVAVHRDNTVADNVRRYHDVLVRLAGRGDIRSEASKYEAVALALVDPDPPSAGEFTPAFPPKRSPLRLSDFFDRLYEQYDQRFVYSAPALETTTRRLEWDPESPVVGDSRIVHYAPRLASL